MLSDGPADDSAGKGVHHRGAVQPPFAGGVLGDVGDPQPVRRVCGELPVDQVGRRLSVRVADGAAAAPPLAEALDAGSAHESGDALGVDRQPESHGQLGVHAGRPVCLHVRVCVDFLDVFEKQFVLLFPRRRRPVFPFVVSGSGNAKQPAGHRDIDIVIGEFSDQPVRYFGRTFSRAKYAAARLRISFSVSSWRLRRRNSASSRRTLPPAGPPPRQETRHRRGRQLDAHHHLAPTRRPECPLPRPGTRAPRIEDQQTASATRPHPPTRTPHRPQSHPRTPTRATPRRLTRTAPTARLRCAPPGAAACPRKHRFSSQPRRARLC